MRPQSSHEAMSDDSNTLSAQLKSSTKDIHRQVETSVLMRLTMKGLLPLKDYIHFLQALLSMYS
jgi:heme oxygenase